MTIRNKTLTAVSLLLAAMITASGCGAIGSSADSSAEESSAVETAAGEISAVETAAAETAAAETSAVETAASEADDGTDSGDETSEVATTEEIKNGKQSDATLSTEENGTLTLTITPADVDDYGYWHQQADTTGTYSFQVSGDSSVEWSVLVMSDEFDDAERYIPQVYKEAMTGTGTVLVEAGSWVYVYCSANGWTGETAGAGCSYSLTIVPEAE